jgi:hypothetical protein
MAPTFSIFIAVLTAVAILIVWETWRRPFFLLAFVLLLLAFRAFVGNTLGLLSSAGGWIILLLVMLGAHFLALVLHAARSTTGRSH